MWRSQSFQRTRPRSHRQFLRPLSLLLKFKRPDWRMRSEFKITFEDCLEAIAASVCYAILGLYFVTVAMWLVVLAFASLTAFLITRLKERSLSLSANFRTRLIAGRNSDSFMSRCFVRFIRLIPGSLVWKSASGSIHIFVFRRLITMRRSPSKHWKEGSVSTYINLEDGARQVC